VERRRLEEGAGIARAAAGRWRIPAEVVEQDPADGDAWLEAMQAAVRRLLS
jgi:hypothetical protein